MHTLTFFPLGNADCCRIDLEGGPKILFDYADMRCAEDDSDLRIDLPTELRQDLKTANRDFYDAVAYSHLDKDHICGSSEFFYLEHATKYQSTDRIKIRELWVPAAAIIEEGLEDEDRIMRAEARYRLKKGSGIRVFSRPEKLKEWLQKEGLTLESRSHLITDAGQLIPGFSLGAQMVEFFVHSPMRRLDIEQNWIRPSRRRMQRCSTLTILRSAEIRFDQHGTGKKSSRSAWLVSSPHR